MSAYVPQPYNERLDSLADLTAPSLTGLLAMNSSGDLVEGGTVQSFGGYNLVQKSATSGGTWGPMDGSAIMFLGDTAYLIGGWYGDIANADWTGNITTNLVYRSTNFGVTWTRIRDHDLTPDSAHFSPRHTFPHCVHRVGSTDYMYLFSGDISEPNSDVRRSTDGITWTKVNSVAPGYDGLSLAAAGSLNGNLYLVGGATVLDTAGHKNAVWRSTDNGVTWTNLGNAPWAIRSTVDRLVNHDGKLWLIGGGIYDDTLGRTYYNDVWSFDGTTWTEVLEDGHSQWTARMYAATFAIGGWLYISRGYNAANLSDTFRSRDGITWFPVNITLEASHADAIGTHADGALIGPGNGLLTNNVNTNSPTRWLEVTGSDDDLPTSIASMISSAQVNPNPEFATIILGLFLYTESGQIGIGEDASGFYVCAGATDSNKTINIGSDATPEIRVKATRLEVSGTIFATAATFNGEVLSYGDTNGTHTLLNRNDNAGSSAYSRLVLNAYGNSWGIGMGSTANNSNALEIREDALGANTLRFAMAIGGAATFNGAVIGESYRATNGYFVSQESGVDKWMSYSVSGTFYLRDAVNSRSHATHFPGVNAAAALTQFSSRLQVDEAATFNGTATFGQGLVATGAYPYGSSGVPGAISYEHPYTRNFAGDGSGYTWAVSKRTGGVTTDLFTIYDASGAATFNGSLTITKTGSNGLVVNNTAGNALAIFNASAASVTDNAYLTIQTAGSDRWYVGQSVSGLTGNFEIYGTAFGGSMLTLNRTTGAMTANAATFNSNVGVGGKIQLSNSGTKFWFCSH
jgi:hypothetical protein